MPSLSEKDKRRKRDWVLVGSDAEENTGGGNADMATGTLWNSLGTDLVYAENLGNVNTAFPAFTVEWFQATNGRLNPAGFFYGSAGQDLFFTVQRVGATVFPFNDNLDLFYNFKGASATRSSPVAPLQWQNKKFHVALVWTGARLKGYANGNQFFDDAVAPAALTPVNGNVQIRTQVDVAATAGSYVKAREFVLSTGALYNANFTPPNPNLPMPLTGGARFYWQVREGAGTNVAAALGGLNLTSNSVPPSVTFWHPWTTQYT